LCTTITNIQEDTHRQKRYIFIATDARKTGRWVRSRKNWGHNWPHPELVCHTESNV